MSKSWMHVPHHSTPGPTMRQQGALPGAKLIHLREGARFEARTWQFINWLSVLKRCTFSILARVTSGNNRSGVARLGPSFKRPYFVVDAVAAGTCVAASQSRRSRWTRACCPPLAVPAFSGVGVCAMASYHYLFKYIIIGESACF